MTVYPLDWSDLFVLCYHGQSQSLYSCQELIQSKELHKKPIHFLFTNDSTARLPFHRIQHVTNIYIHYDRTCTPKSTEAQTRKGDDKRIGLCFETEDLHQDCPGIHEKCSIIIKLLSVQLEENYYQFQVRFLPGPCLSVLCL